jgi:hypothetical protein
MGLDVYLKHCANLDKANAIEEEYETKSNEIWDKIDKKYEDMTDEEKNSAHDACVVIAEELGLGKFGESLEKETIEQDSVKYRDHLFKVGYFRSSYNDGGFNSVMDSRGLFGLYEIFDAENGESSTPDWNESLGKVKEAIAQFKEYLGSVDAKYSVFDISARKIREDSWCVNKEDALNKFIEQIEKTKTHGESGYGNALGEFIPKGITVYGLLRGTGFGGDNIYVVTDSSELDWYLNALEIVQETIEFVLSQPDPRNYYLVWSG